VSRKLTSRPIAVIVISEYEARFIRSAATLEPMSTELAKSAIPPEDPWNGSEEFLAVLLAGLQENQTRDSCNEMS
jgi:hypothetical protein